MTGYLVSEDDQLKLLQIAHSWRAAGRLTQGEEPGRSLDGLSADELASMFFAQANAMEEILGRSSFVPSSD